WDLTRLTGQSGAVIERSAAELAVLPLAGSASRAETIPTLRRLLDLVGGKVPLLIEVKSRRGVRVAPLCLAARRQLEG
ncbi:hypothetical protein, partial [Klebsiella pneumoniae]|uniref:hypothetical protein n=1 Tax=Klebsiella pneumoniae TaxID=573 RepID=UPI003852C019